MKHILLFYIVFQFCGFSQDTLRLSGKYKIEYDKEYNLPSSTIVIKDSIYDRIFTNGRRITGKIKYWNHIVTLNDDNSSQQIELEKSKIKQGTIKFGTKETDPKKSLTMSYMEISINTGKISKLK